MNCVNLTHFRYCNMSVLQGFRSTQHLQLQRHFFFVIGLGREGLALPHRQVLLGEEQCQEAWNDHSIACGARVANPIDLSCYTTATCANFPQSMRLKREKPPKKEAYSMLWSCTLEIRSRSWRRWRMSATEDVTHFASVHCR